MFIGTIVPCPKALAKLAIQKLRTKISGAQFSNCGTLSAAKQAYFGFLKRPNDLILRKRLPFFPK